MLVNYTQKNINPTPAYGTIRYSGAIKFEGNGNKYINNSPTYIGFSSPCTKIDKWSKKSKNKKTIEKEDSICKNSIKSSILSFCGKESRHCTCKDEESYTLENGRKLKKLSKESSICYTNWEEIQKLTDTSETRLTDSFERLLNCVKNSRDINMYLDLFEPYPREERRIKEKDSTPPGYNITLILPQCVCLKNYQENRQTENESDENIYEKSETISELICAPSVVEFSWNVMQSDIIEKIPQKYITNIFE
ncbi:hypothetical protein K0M31_001398 [Melipona bicolor]|uniref:Uncharacterized protein n=1 Tax=Melipona bicolor TaxID=60889 RepID=A0AA40KXQ8_9HYME|nr:hypothetical protein K0M31_001398 [Melipona bicolor]